MSRKRARRNVHKTGTGSLECLDGEGAGGGEEQKELKVHLVSWKLQQSSNAQGQHRTFSLPLCVLLVYVRYSFHRSLSYTGSDHWSPLAHHFCSDGQTDKDSTLLDPSFF